MGKTYTVKLPTDRITTFFIAGDWHSDHLHRPSLDIMLKHAQLFPKHERNLIINGDFFDAEYMMPKNEMFKKWIERKDGIDEFFLPKFLAEMKWSNDILDEVQSVFNRVFYVDGNHCEERIRLFREKYCPPVAAHLFNSYTNMRLAERGIPYIEYNDWLDIGEVTVTHGMYHGPSAHKKHYSACGSRSVIFSHVHSAESHSYTVRGNTKMSWSLPAMCTLNPEYIKNREQNWSNGYGTLHMKPTGHFNFFIHNVWDEELILPTGQVLKAK